MSRLAVLKENHTPEVRAMLEQVRAEGGFVSDVGHMLMYREELCGRPLSEAFQDVMRGPSEWSVGERELIAAFTSIQNQCPF